MDTKNTTTNIQPTKKLKFGFNMKYDKNKKVVLKTVNKYIVDQTINRNQWL